MIYVIKVPGLSDDKVPGLSDDDPEQLFLSTDNKVFGRAMDLPASGTAEAEVTAYVATVKGRVARHHLVPRASAVGVLCPHCWQFQAGGPCAEYAPPP
jgi:hypothetical protein